MKLNKNNGGEKMENEEYAVACTEVLEVLNYISKEDYNKVPRDVIQVLEKNKKDDIVFLYNPWKDINEQKMSETGRMMLVSFFRDYWATEVQKNKIKAFQNNKRHQIEEENRQKYNTDIFKNRNTTINESQNEQAENIQLVEYKENIFRRILGFFRKMFGK